MSNTESNPALFESRECPIVDGHRLIQHLSSRKAEVGGIPINRVLPQRERRMIGAWCFLDHAGPAVFTVDSQGMRVGPHPHTGLQTFTWMLAGDILHRDSLGSEQVIRPGEVNLMTAGRGIAHTEESLASESQLHAAQLWIALPHAHRHTEPRFDHYPVLPRWQEQGVDITLLTGAFNGHEAPTLAFSPLVGADMLADAETTVHLDLYKGFEYGVLVLEGSLRIGQDTFSPNELAYLGCGLDAIALELDDDTRVLLLGGEPLNEEIFIWWNFVGHSKAEIAQAQQEWEAGDTRFGDVPEFDGDRLMPPPIPWRMMSDT
uniref:pirin family protein n=2 Tax=Halomonas TaxID=2745 RepID=UPI00262EA43B|nr:pirin family protein [uncultured Halomonas sp.]